MDSPNTCSIVLVAGDTINNLQEVMQKVDSMGQNMLKIPYAVVLLVENPNFNLTTNRHAMTPAVVSRLIKHANILGLANLIIYCT